MKAWFRPLREIVWARVRSSRSILTTLRTLVCGMSVNTRGNELGWSAFRSTPFRYTGRHQTPPTPAPFMAKRQKLPRSRTEYVPPSRSTAAEKKIIDHSTRNRKFKRLEPHFQPSATITAPKEDTKSVVALAHSRECANELIYIRSANFWLDENVRSWSRNTKCPRNKKRGKRASNAFVVGTYFWCFVGTVQYRC